MESTVPYTPQQNGVAERMNRSIMERSRAMLDDARFKRSMWSEAVMAAVYLINRSPSAALLESKTPYEMWFGHKPNVSKLRVFGSKVFSHIPKEKRSKLEAKSQICYLVGYGINGYRLWNPAQRKIIISRDVIIEETKAKITNSNEIYTDDHLVTDKLSMNGNELNSATENAHPQIKEAQEVPNVDTDESEIEDQIAVRRSQRERRPPNRLAYFDMCVAFALNAESFVEEIPERIEELQERDDWLLWKAAINEEMRSLEKNNTWDLVDLPADKTVVPCKWVFKIKASDAVPRYKARLVAKGCSQRYGFDYQETYAPVVRMTTVRILLSVALQQNLHMHQMDVCTAFLNGELTETVYMRQPPGFERGNKVCRLNKSLYGLKQAPRSWNERFNSFLLRLGFRRSQYDTCLYVKNSNEVRIYLVLYVDDIVLASNSLEEMMLIKKQLKREFEMKDLQELHHFLGLNIKLDKSTGTLALNQNKYVSDLLKRFGMENCKPVSTPMEVNLKLEKLKENELPTCHPYRELIGCLTYLMLSTRPDISNAVNILSRFQSCASDLHWIHLKRILRYLQGTRNYSLIYEQRKNVEPIIGFADADWASDINDRRSTSGYLFQVHGNLISWTTRKQSTVSLSSTEAEYISLSQAACELIWLRNLLSEFDVILNTPTVIFEDNQSCIHIATEPRDQKRMKHLDIRYNYIRDCVQNGYISVKYVATQKQLADIFTKALPATVFHDHRKALGLRRGVDMQT